MAELKKLKGIVGHIWQRLKETIPFTLEGRAETGRLKARYLAHSLLSQHFDIGELHQLAFELDIDPETLAVPDNDRDGLVRAMMVRALNEGNIKKLIKAAQRERPFADWPEL